MSQDAAERLRRLISALPSFAENECISHAELERRTGVRAPDLLEDLRAVTERSDTPGGFVEDLRVEFERGNVTVHSSLFQRPMRITIPELCALELGLAMLASGTPPDERSAIDRARAKLRTAIVRTPGPALDESWRAPAPTAADSVMVGALQTAAKGTAKVRITYQSSSADEPTERVIHPYAVLPWHDTWFVVAHCERSAGLRFFRADRLYSALVLSETFTPPETLPIAELMATGKPFHGSHDEMLIVRYSPRIARWIAEREGKEVEADGSLVVEHPLADDQWAIRHVLQYGPEAEALAPPRIREQLRAALELLIGDQ